MTDESFFLIEETKEQMQTTLFHFEKELTKLRAGKANSQIFDDVKFEYYGVLTPINQAANINIPDAKTIVIQPFDRSALSAIEKAVLAANLGFTPMNNGEIIRISIPPLTEERRKDLVKKARNEAEQTKVAVRNIRRNANEKAKKFEKDGLPEDEAKKLEKDIQEATDKIIEKIDKILETKEKDIMAI